MEKPIEILLAEDSPSDAEMTIRALKRSNVSNRLIHLRDGAETLDYIFGTGAYEKRDLNDQPKVILLDLKMPKIDGMEVLRRIKNDERTRAIPVVVLTSSKEDPDIQKCYQLGANSYIVKPVHFDNFMKAVAELGMYWVLLNQKPD
jgi:two-component system response regulator